MRKILVFGVLFWRDQLILEIEKFVCEWHRNTKITFQSIKSVKTLNNTFTMWGNLYWGSSTLHYFEIGKRYHVTLFNSLKITTLLIQMWPAQLESFVMDFLVNIACYTTWRFLFRSWFIKVYHKRYKFTGNTIS